MTIPSETKLGPYEIVAPIGAGGMGEVYRARDTRLSRDVAIKVLPATFSSDSDRLRRFEQEARAAGALNHPNILAIYDIGLHDGAPFLVTELLEGETLGERLRAGPLPLRKAVDTAVQVAQGIAAAHEKGIVHRDLKPANIFLGTDGRAKILDFGLAKLSPSHADGASLTALTHAAQAGPETHPGAVLGTAGYMSPEQVRGLPADARSDLFSLGTVLYEMLSGTRAFRGDSSIETMNAILKEEPPEISTANHGVPPALERIVLRCLEKNPAERFQSARDLAFALEALSGSSTSLTAPSAMDKAGSRGRKWLLPVSSIALIVSLAAGSYFAGLSRGRNSASGSGSASFTALTFKQEAIFSARFLPDGETVVYSAALEGNQPELFVRRRDSPESQPMGVHDSQLLSISSKGELALLTKAQFLGHRWFTGTLARMDMGTGAPREVLENVHDADWSPDGSSLAILRQVSGQDRLEFPVGKVLYQTGGYLSDLRVSPRGDRIAFMDHPNTVDDRGFVSVVDLQGHKTVLTGEFSGEEGLAWSPSGDEIYFAGQVGDTYVFPILAVGLSGKLRTVLSAANTLWMLDVGPKGQFLVDGIDERCGLISLGSGTQAEHDLSWLDLTCDAAISPDGRFVLFTESELGTNYALGHRGVDGSPIVRLGDGVAFGLSLDGKWALSALPSAPMQLVIYPTGAGEPKKLERGHIEYYTRGQFFSDGKRVLSCGGEPGHGSRCYVQDVAGGVPAPVTPEGTLDGFVSPDDKSVLARAADGAFSIYPIEGGAARPAPPLGRQEQVILWNSDGRSVLVYRLNQVPARVERLDLDTGKRAFLRELVPLNRAGILLITKVSFSEDARSYAYIYTRNLSRLALVQGAK